MPFWTLYGLSRGLATTSWPEGQDAQVQPGVLGLPTLDPQQCRENCRACADVCLPGAITVQASADTERLTIDYGRCIACQLCTELCPTGAFKTSVIVN